MGASVLVYGLGVIGSVYAARLAQAGFAVSALARGERLAALREHGVVIRNAFLGDEERVPVTVLEKLPAGASFDLILVAVRAGQIDDALAAIGPGRAKAVAVIGNNLGDLDRQAEAVGPDRFVAGFGAFGGYRDGAAIVYTDGRKPGRSADRHRGPTTLGVISGAARPALETARGILASAGLVVNESPDMRSWLACHAALVFPLAGAIYACAGDQARTCRTRDALVLGMRACKELLRALGGMGIRTEPGRLKTLIGMPEWYLVGVMAKAFAGEGARVAMFGHANAVGGRGELGGQARALDRLVRRAGRPLPSWDRMLPYLEGAADPMPDGSRKMKLRLW